MISLEIVRKILRYAGRFLIFCLLAFLCATKWLHPEGIRHTYISGYQNIRQMGLMKRLFSIPNSRHIPELFEILYWADLSYQIIAGLLILFGKRFGGWMLFFWQLIKILVCYSPYLLAAARLPFTHRQRFDMVRNFAILGVSLALTHIYKPLETDRKAQETKNA